MCANGVYLETEARSREGVKCHNPIIINFFLNPQFKVSEILN